MNFIGLDACKLGWCGIGLYDNTLIWDCYKNLDEVLKKHPNIQRILIDIPIGLSSINFSRTVDTQARTYLNKRKSSIFSPPCREALQAKTYKEALAINRQICKKGISIQAYNIGSKIKAVDQWLEHKPETIQVFEAHPELCFKTLNNNCDLKYSKHDKAGLDDRLEILLRHNKILEFIYQDILKQFKRYEVKRDDILDAMALFLIQSFSKLKYFEDNNNIDETGKRVRIVYG